MPMLIAPRRCARHSRVVAIVLMMVLGLVFQPLVVALGEIHELLSHVVDQRDGLSRHAGEDEAIEDGSPLHALSHHAHCCAQPQWLPPTGLPALPPAMAGMRPPGVDPDASPDSRIDTPFRPPIVA